MFQKIKLEKISLRDVLLTRDDGNVSKGFINVTFDQVGSVFDLKASPNIRISHFLKTLAGLMQPIGGDVYFNNYSLYNLDFFEAIDLRLKIGYSFDLGGLLNNRSIQDNLLLPLDYHNILSPDERKEKVFSLLKDFEIFEYANMLPALVPGRVRKMVIVLRPLLLNPQVLILDDPWTGLLDHQRKRMVNHIVERMQDGNLRFVFIYDSLNLKLFNQQKELLIEYRIRQVAYDGIEAKSA
ncbi:MAG: ABC transporter ATP-binding protein [Bdellovibrionaceae bacterium]|nr:ABC transporter ATP-binding protein [Pseudobdellovibrionaceae bacterium]MDW8191170.1 ABC transporter ATP-binding protein [Pseudobdellovibrionaceae bacterium]